jgi:hypothetical protein
MAAMAAAWAVVEVVEVVESVEVVEVVEVVAAELVQATSETVARHRESPTGLRVIVSPHDRAGYGFGCPMHSPIYPPVTALRFFAFMSRSYVAAAADFLRNGGFVTPGGMGDYLI